jgi:hypothetical protein
MNPIRRTRRSAAALAGLALAWLGLAVAAPAAFASRAVPPPVSGAPGTAGLHEPPGWNQHPPLPGQAAAAVAEHHEVPTGALPAPLTAHLHQLAHQAPSPVPGHTVVVGGMPGWQITLIAAGAAVLAAVLAVTADRGPRRWRHIAAPSPWAFHS